MFVEHDAFLLNFVVWGNTISGHQSFCLLNSWAKHGLDKGNFPRDWKIGQDGFDWEVIMREIKN